MSVIVAVKENGVVYMGADTQTSTAVTKNNYANATRFKIRKLPNGILVGICGVVRVSQLITENRDLFSLDENGNLTKTHIVRNIVPKIIDILSKDDRFEKDGTMSVVLLLAHKGRMFRINDDFAVYEAAEYVAIGAGRCYAAYPLSDKTKAVRERILGALCESDRRIDSVSAPFVLTDTKNAEFEVCYDCRD